MEEESSEEGETNPPVKYLNPRFQESSTISARSGRRRRSVTAQLAQAYLDRQRATWPGRWFASQGRSSPRHGHAGIKPRGDRKKDLIERLEKALAPPALSSKGVMAVSNCGESGDDDRYPVRMISDGHDKKRNRKES